MLSLIPRAFHHAGDALGQLPTDANGPLRVVLGPLQAPPVSLEVGPPAAIGQHCVLVLAVASELPESGDEALVRSPELRGLLDRQSSSQSNLASHTLINLAPYHIVVGCNISPIVELVEIAAEGLF